MVIVGKDVIGIAETYLEDGVCHIEPFLCLVCYAAEHQNGMDKLSDDDVVVTTETEKEFFDPGERGGRC